MQGIEDRIGGTTSRGVKQMFDEVPCLKNQRIVLKQLEERDALSLQELVEEEMVYRSLPVFLYERRYSSQEAIGGMYRRNFSQRGFLLLGIYLEEARTLCGLLELYGLREEIHKVSIGCRLREKYWNRGIATEAVALMVEYLFGYTGIEIITASVKAGCVEADRVLTKNGFIQNVAKVEEDWGYPQPTPVEKWILMKE